MEQGYWVRFTADGTPEWFGVEPIDGAEWVEGVDRETLVTFRRVNGKWVDRLPEPEAKPDPATLEAEYQEALQVRQAQVLDAIASSDVYARFMMGQMTLTAYRDAAAEIAASIPMPTKPQP